MKNVVITLLLVFILVIAFTSILSSSKKRIKTITSTSLEPVSSEIVISSTPLSSEVSSSVSSEPILSSAEVKVESKIPEIVSSTPVEVKEPELLGGVTFIAKGMPEELYNIPYSPEKIDTDEEYKEVVIDLEKFYHYSELESLMLELGKSNIVDLFKIGTSADNRNIYSIEIGTGEEKQLFTAGVHAREVANPLFMLKYISSLLNEYTNNNEDIINLLKTKRICIMPVCNPDGYEASLWGNLSIKNRDLFITRYTDQELTILKSNANGINLNRSFPTYAAGMIYHKIYPKATAYLSPDFEAFSGYTLGSEPETQAMIKWYKEHLPKSKNYVDVHSQGRIIYHGKMHLSNTLNSLCESLANLVKESTGYSIIPLSTQLAGQGPDGTNTDFVDEFNSGFVYNSTLGRLIPPESDIYSLITKYEGIKYNVRAITFETLNQRIAENKNASLQLAEWNDYKLYDTFLKICKS